LSDDAPVTDPGTVMGTIGYMAPEQLQGRPADVRSDIFSYGAVLYEMLAGRRVFRGENPADTMAAILKRDPAELSQIRPEVTPGLERIVARCLEKRPEERFQSARDVAFAFEALSAGSGTGRPFGPFRRWRRRSTTAVVLAVVLGAGFLAGRLTAPHPVPVFQRLSLKRGPIRAARFLPDGRTVVYSPAGEAGRSRVFSTQAGAPEPQVLDLPKGAVLGVSLAGEMAVLLGQTADPSGTLARVPATGGSLHALSPQVVDASWGPNGRLCVLRTLRGDQQLEFPPGQVLFRPTRPIHSPRVSPKGDRIAFSNGEGIQVIDTAGTNLVTLTSQSPVKGLAWSPRGDEVWFTAGETESRALHAVSLSGRSRLVYRLPGNATLEDISADGRLLLTQGFEHKGIAILAPGAGRERELAGYARPRVAALSSDGRTLLIHEEADRAGHGDAVYLQRTDGSPPIRLGEGRALDLSPDGSRALVVVPCSWTWSAESSASSRAWTLRTPSAGPPTGVRVRAAVGVRGRVFRVDPTRGEKEISRELLPSDPEGVTRVDTVDLTPDGQFYAYTYSRQLLDLYLVEGLKKASSALTTSVGAPNRLRMTPVIAQRGARSAS